MSVELPVFIDRICESGLMTREQVAAFQGSLPAEAQEDIEAFCRELITAKILTRYQIGRILHGRHQGLVMGNNILLERIGEGGMGRVYKAQHKNMKRSVAVKIINETALGSDRSRRRFMMEVQTAAKLMHPNIVTAYDADEQDGVPYLVMEYVDGKNLRNVVYDNGPLNFATAIDYIRQAAEGLKYAHSQGIVHRDIKPSNLLVDKKGRVKILDMGLARTELAVGENSDSALQELTKDKHIVGTVEYMSPEQASDDEEVDARSDIYSLGCSLYFLIVGKPPFHRSTPIKTLLAHRADPIPKLSTTIPDISREAEMLFAKMVAKHPDDRHQTAQELIEEIEDLDGDSEFAVLDNSDEQDTESFDEGMLTATAEPDDDSGEVHIGPRYDKLKEHAVGIDLGTTFSAVSYLDSTGRPVTLVNAEGEKITPSILLFDDEGVIVGKEAAKAMTTDMPMIAECAKRDLGASMFHKRFHGKRIRPEVLLAYILQKLKRDAEEQIGPIRRAVITVPAYFDEIRRKATQDAGYLAGLDVMDIINEPTSAAVAYGYQQAMLQSQSEESKQFFERPQRVLVYDLGGGTFDITIMEIRRDVYRTLATDGDVRLGGRDWDERLVDFICDKFLEQTGGDPRLDANTLGRLVRECEDAKRTLSSRQKATVSFEFEGKALKLTISRTVFQELTRDLLARTEFTTLQTLKEAGLNWKKINRILMVGGSTRMPAVTEMLERISGIKPDRSVAPDEAVAHGAAIRAGMILLEKQGESMPIKIVNVNSHSLGVVGTNPKTGEKQAGVLIPRNTPLPASAERVFRTQKENQSSVLVQIVEGENSNPDECSFVGKCIVHNLPKKLPARTPITIHFQYDENGRLTVWVRVVGMELKQQIMRENSLTADEMERWRRVICGEADAQPAS